MSKTRGNEQSGGGASCGLAQIVADSLVALEMTVPERCRSSLTSRETISVTEKEHLQRATCLPSLDPWSASIRLLVEDSGDDEFVMVPENRDICGSV